MAAGFITGGVLAIRGKAYESNLNRWSECSFQECSSWRCDSSPNRRSVSRSDLDFNAQTVPNDGGDAESRDG